MNALKIRKHRYTIHEGVYIIEVRVKVPEQLFDIRDPAPFRERDLDESFFRYLMTSSKEVPRSKAMKILISIERRQGSDYTEASIEEAIKRYFLYREETQENELQKFLKRTQIYLFIGLGILFACLGIAEQIPEAEASWGLNVLREGLIVLGWVSIWKPIELIMYGWFPVYQELRFYRRLLNAHIDVDFVN
jgi:hypothetical protein